VRLEIQDTLENGRVARVARLVRVAVEPGEQDRRGEREPAQLTRGTGREAVHDQQVGAMVVEQRAGRLARVGLGLDARQAPHPDVQQVVVWALERHDQGGVHATLRERPRQLRAPHPVSAPSPGRVDEDLQLPPQSCSKPASKSTPVSSKSAYSWAVNPPSNQLDEC